MRSVLNPELPNNHGSLAPIKVEAPVGSIVNAVSPQPCTARHVVGMFLPNALLKALAQIKPEQAMAEGSRRGVDDAGQRQPRRRPPFITAMFTYAGGVGARAAKPGLSACSYPTGVAAVPVEVVEASAPIRFLRKELRAGQRWRRRSRSAGSARRSSSRVDTARPWQLNAVTSRLAVPPEGIFGGERRRGRLVHRQRRAGPHAAARHAAAGRSSCASTCPVAAATAQSRRSRRAAGVTTWPDAALRSATCGPTPSPTRSDAHRSCVFEASRRATYASGPTPSSTCSSGAGVDVLAERGVGPGDAVHLALTNSPAFVAVWLATAASRRLDRAVRSDGHARPNWRGHIERTRPSGRLCAPTARADQYLPRACGGVPAIVEVDEADTDLAAVRRRRSHDRLAASSQPRDRAAVMFTSGTTGRPKGVEITQANYAFAGKMMAEAAGLRAAAPPARRAAAVPRQRAVLLVRLGDLGRRLGGPDAHVLGQRLPRAGRAARGDARQPVRRADPHDPRPRRARPSTACGCSTAGTR